MSCANTGQAVEMAPRNILEARPRALMAAVHALAVAIALLTGSVVAVSCWWRLCGHPYTLLGLLANPALNLAPEALLGGVAVGVLDGRSRRPHREWRRIVEAMLIAFAVVVCARTVAFARAALAGGGEGLVPISELVLGSFTRQIPTQIAVALVSGMSYWGVVRWRGWAIEGLFLIAPRFLLSAVDCATSSSRPDVRVMSAMTELAGMVTSAFLLPLLVRVLVAACSKAGMIERDQEKIA